MISLSLRLANCLIVTWSTPGLPLFVSTRRNAASRFAFAYTLSISLYQTPPFTPGAAPLPRAYGGSDSLAVLSPPGSPCFMRMTFRPFRRQPPLTPWHRFDTLPLSLPGLQDLLVPVWASPSVGRAPPLRGAPAGPRSVPGAHVLRRTPLLHGVHHLAQVDRDLAVPRGEVEG